jgi:hypothetical protein
MKTALEYAQAAFDGLPWWMRNEAETQADVAEVLEGLTKAFEEAMAQHVGQEFATTWDDPI